MFGVCEQQSLRPVSANFVQTDQGICYLLFVKYNLLTSEVSLFLLASVAKARIFLLVDLLEFIFGLRVVGRKKINKKL